MKLLSPLQIGSLEVKNRIVSNAHGAFMEYYKPGDPGDRYIAYQERRVKRRPDFPTPETSKPGRSTSLSPEYRLHPGRIYFTK